MCFTINSSPNKTKTSKSDSMLATMHIFASRKKPSHGTFFTTLTNVGTNVPKQTSSNPANPQNSKEIMIVPTDTSRPATRYQFPP
jgi:hypothetical protein